MSECSCKQKFRTAEDYRDHLPCDATERRSAQDRLIKAAIAWVEWDSQFAWIPSDQDADLIRAVKAYLEWHKK